MRQTIIHEFEPRIVTVYIPIRLFPYKTRRGLAEVQAKRLLEKQCWQMWRGGFIHANGHDLYPAVQKRYQELARLVTALHGSSVFEKLCLLSSVHHGMPDFVCFHPQLMRFKFVECKLGYEALSERQIKTLKCLQHIGFTTEIYRLVEPKTKTRRALFDLETRRKKVLEKELMLKRF